MTREAGDDGTGADKVQSLERRYIDLLERRIKDLETLVEKSNGRRSDGKPGPQSGGGDKAAGADKGADAEDEDDKTDKPAHLVRLRERVINDGGVDEERDCDPSEFQALDAASDKDKGRATPFEMTWVRILSEERKYKSSEFTVETPELQALLRVTLAHYPNLHFPPLADAAALEVGGDPIKFESPFVPLLHNYDRLRALAAEDGDAGEKSPAVAELEARLALYSRRASTTTTAAKIDTSLPENQAAWACAYLGRSDNLRRARDQLKRMLAHVTKAPELASYFSSLDAQRNAKSIQFDGLWTIFPPGEIVYSELFMSEPQIFIVKSSEPPKRSSDDDSDDDDELWTMVAWSYDWNGHTFKRMPVRFSFESFMGTRAISTLHCHPLRFHESDDGGSLSALPPADVSTTTGTTSTTTPPAGTTKLSSLEQMLLERGRRFRELCIKPKGSQMFNYNGPAISHGAGFSKLGDGGDFGEEYELRVLRGLLGRRRTLGRAIPVEKLQPQTRGRVMVDFKAYIQNAPRRGPFGPMGNAFFIIDEECRCSTCIANPALRANQGADFDGARGDREFEELQYKLCPPRVLGYHLETKMWLELNIGTAPAEAEEGDWGRSRDDLLSLSPGRGGGEDDGEDRGRYLTDIEQLTSDEAFNKLQLARTQKALIRDLVQSHASSGTSAKPLMTDIMKGKGRGLVILLHGPPGVGKTLTAESVAQLAGKPLFSVGVSDIGLNPEDVEHNLEALFELAANWRAVLLFDEADVFLESRSSHTSDLNRNALVSVLLRVLEYYDGILILTTNRIREFDVAVQSRVNLGIKYEDLDRDQKQEIFDNFIRQLQPENVQDREGIKDWFRSDEEAREWVKPLNGRQIRNILFSAASLAVKDGGRLKLDHVKKMTKSTSMFYESIKSIVDDARRKAEAGGRP